MPNQFIAKRIERIVFLAPERNLIAFYQLECGHLIHMMKTPAKHDIRSGILGSYARCFECVKEK